MPKSRQARMTRSAISPRFATRIRWNMGNCKMQIAKCKLQIVRNENVRVEPASVNLILDLHRAICILQYAIHLLSTTRLDQLGTGPDHTRQAAGSRRGLPR